MTDDQAREHLEELLWPDGKPVCRHCGSVNAYKMQGASCRPGLCRCRDCKKQFTVTVGTIFEDSHIPLRKWVRAFHLMCSSKKGISALQLQRNLGLGSYRTAWHMAHRIRLAMRCEPMAGLLAGKVESDEVWVGGKPRKIAGKGAPKRGSTKTPVHTLVERDGRKRTRVMASVTANNLKKNIDALVDANAEMHTDDNASYDPLRDQFKGGHRVVNHSAYEYYRKIDGASINTAESSHALIKRGVYGTFHHISVKHMQRYLDEFDFRWDHRKTNDVERTHAALSQVEGKRLMYRSPNGQTTT
jgi:transposase-like protein